jgi:integrase
MVKYSSPGRRGRRLWWPRVAAPEDLRRAAELENAYGPGANGKTKERVCADFADLQTLNAVSAEEALPIFAGQALLAGLAAGTLETYMKYLRTFFRGSSYATYSHWLGIVERAHADAETRHAPDHGSSFLHDVVRTAEKGRDQAMGAVLWVLLTCGARVRDLVRLRRRQIAVDDEMLCIQFRLTKNRAKRALRVTLNVPVHWAGKASMRTKRFINRGDPNERPFGHLSATKVNRALKRLAPKHTTTYSFRRRFFNDIYDHMPRRDTTAYTLHLDEKTIEAFYQRWCRDEEGASQMLS